MTEVSNGKLNLRTTAADEEDTVIDVMHEMTTDNLSFNPELRALVAAAIRRFPNTEAQHWIGPEAVLAVVEKFLIRAAGERQKP